MRPDTMWKKVDGSITTLRTLSVFLAWVLCVNPAYAARLSEFDDASRSRAPVSGKPTIKEQVANIPAGSLVNVRLKSRDELRGRLGDVSDEGMVLKIAKKKQIEERKVAFREVKSISVVKQHSMAYRILLPTAIVCGVLLVVLAISLTVRPPG